MERKKYLPAPCPASSVGGVIYSQICEIVTILGLAEM
jgi:hypothetical protein